MNYFNIKMFFDIFFLILSHIYSLYIFSCYSLPVNCNKKILYLGFYSNFFHTIFSFFTPLEDFCSYFFHILFVVLYFFCNTLYHCDNILPFFLFILGFNCSNIITVVKSIVTLKKDNFFHNNFCLLIFQFI